MSGDTEKCAVCGAHGELVVARADLRLGERMAADGPIVLMECPDCKRILCETCADWEYSDLVGVYDEACSRCWYGPEMPEDAT